MPYNRMYCANVERTFGKALMITICALSKRLSAMPVFAARNGNITIFLLLSAPYHWWEAWYSSL
jgi:hypothetical protein